MISWCVLQIRTLINFIHTLYKECKSVHCQSFQEVIAQSMVVVIVALVLAFLLLAPMDIAIFALMRWLLIS